MTNQNKNVMLVESYGELYEFKILRGLEMQQEMGDISSMFNLNSHHLSSQIEKYNISVDLTVNDKNFEFLRDSLYNQDEFVFIYRNQIYNTLGFRPEIWDLNINPELTLRGTCDRIEIFGIDEYKNLFSNKKLSDYFKKRLRSEKIQRLLKC